MKNKEDTNEIIVHSWKSSRFAQFLFGGAFSLTRIQGNNSRPPYDVHNNATDRFTRVQLVLQSDNKHQLDLYRIAWML